VLEPQLGALDPDTLLLGLGAYRVAAHPSGPALAAAALPHVARHLPQLRPSGLVHAAQVYGRMRRTANGFAAQPALGGEPGSGSGGGGGGGGASHGIGGNPPTGAVEELLAGINAAAARQLADFMPAGRRATAWLWGGGRDNACARLA
jgi:hypothetical protein